MESFSIRTYFYSRFSLFLVLFLVCSIYTSEDLLDTEYDQVEDIDLRQRLEQFQR